MTTKRVNPDAVIGMLHRAERFDQLPPAQQAALRAQVTRTLKATDDPDIAAVMEQIQSVIGVAADRPAERMTAAELVDEYEAFYTDYSPRQRAAFKAKASRLLNLSRERGDEAEAEAVAELTDRIAREEEAGQRDLIRRLTEQLRKA